MKRRNFLILVGPDEEKERREYLKALRHGDNSECIKEQHKKIEGEIGTFGGMRFLKS